MWGPTGNPHRGDKAQYVPGGGATGGGRATWLLPLQKTQIPGGLTQRLRNLCRGKEELEAAVEVRQQVIQEGCTELGKELLLPPAESRLFRSVERQDGFVHLR